MLFIIGRYKYVLFLFYRLKKIMKEKDLVIVKSGDRLFEGLIEKIDWDIDQNIYLINGEWFCQSEVTLKKTIKN